MAKTPKKHGYSLLFKDSAIYGAGTTLQKFLMVLLMPLYTAFLTPADYGVVGMVNVTAQFIYVFINLGFDIAMSRFYFDDGGETQRRKVIGVTFLVWTVYPAVLLGLFIALMPRLTPLLMGPGDYWMYFDIGMVNIFFTNFVALPYMLMRLDHRPLIFVVFTISRVLIQVGTTVLLVVVLQWGIYGVLIGTLVGSMLVSLATVPTFWRRIDLHLDRPLVRSMFGMAIPALLTGSVFFFLKLSDRWFIMRYWNTTQVGLYTAAFQLSQPVYLVMTAFNMAWPQWHYSRLGNPAEHKRLVARSATYFITLCTFLLVGMGVFMPLLIRLLLHREAYWSIGATTLVLTLANVFYSLYYVLWVGCNVAKKNRKVPLITAVASAVNIGMNLLLIPRFGIIAAAWDSALGFALLAGLVYVLSQRYYPIRYEWMRFLKMALAGLATLAVAWAIGSAVGLSVYLELGQVFVRELAVAPALLLFPLLLVATRFFTPGERQALAGGWSRLRRRGPAPQAPLIGAASADHPADELSPDDVAAEAEEVEIEAETRLEAGRGDAAGV